MGQWVGLGVINGYDVTTYWDGEPAGIARVSLMPFANAGDKRAVISNVLERYGVASEVLTDLDAYGTWEEGKWVQGEIVYSLREYDLGPHTALAGRVG